MIEGARQRLARLMGDTAVELMRREVRRTGRCNAGGGCQACEDMAAELRRTELEASAHVSDADIITGVELRLAVGVRRALPGGIHTGAATTAWR